MRANPDDEITVAQVLFAFVFACVVFGLVLSGNWTTLVAALIAAPFVTVLPEAGHAAAGAMVGRPPRAVQIFGKRKLATATLGRVVVVIGMNPWAGGMTINSGGRLPRSRSRDAVMIVAGPLTGIAIAVVAWGAARGG